MDYLIIKTYKKLWRLDYKIYALGTKLPLPRALPVRLASYFCIAALAMMTVNKLPFMSGVPFAVKAVLTLGMTKLLDTVKLDGKNPLLFFGGYLWFLLLERGIHIEHFQEHAAERTVPMHWEAGNQSHTRNHPIRAIRVRWAGGMRGGSAFV